VAGQLTATETEISAALRAPVAWERPYVFVHLCLLYHLCLQCFGAVGWAAGRASGLKKKLAVSAGMVICLERGADLHMAQPMPPPLTVSSFSIIHIGFTFLVPAHPGSPGQMAVKHVCVCVCVCVTVCVFTISFFTSVILCRHLLVNENHQSKV